MNILPKKRWHVRTKDNIARVRRDEAKAAEEEKEIQRRAQLAEQEARTAFLRERARSQRSIDVPHTHHESPALKGIEEEEGHVNLFSKVEDGQKSWGSNKEHEKEKKEEQEKYEKSIGLLTYLGQSALDAKGENPWYYKAPEARLAPTDDGNKQKEIGLKTKGFLDPLNEVRKHVDFSKKKVTSSSSSTSGRPSKLPKLQNTSKEAKQPHFTLLPLEWKRTEKEKKRKKSSRHHHHHKQSKKKKKRKRSESEDSEAEVEKKKSKLEVLRMERVRREKEEKKKAEKLLATWRGEKTEDEKKEELSGISDQQHQQQTYNSQFNPHLARKPKIHPHSSPFK